MSIFGDLDGSEDNRPRRGESTKPVDFILNTIRAVREPRQTKSEFSNFEPLAGDEVRRRPKVQPERTIELHPSTVDTRHYPGHELPERKTRTLDTYLELQPTEPVDLLSQAANLVQLDVGQVGKLRSLLRTRTTELENYILEEVVVEMLAAKQALSNAIVVVRDGMGQEVTGVSLDFLVILNQAKQVQMVEHVLAGERGSWKHTFMETLSRMYAERAATMSKGALPSAPEDVTRLIGAMRSKSRATQEQENHGRKK